MMTRHSPTMQVPRIAPRIAQRIANRAGATYTRALDELRSLALRQGAADGRQIAASAWPDLAPLASEPAPAFALALERYERDLHHGGGHHRAMGRGRYRVTRRRGPLTPGQQECELRQTLEAMDTLVTAGATLEASRAAGVGDVAAMPPGELMATPAAAVRFFARVFAQAAWAGFVEATLTARRGGAAAA